MAARRIIGRRVVGGAPQLKVSVDGYDSDKDEWVDAARASAPSSVASHNDEGASPGRAASRPPRPTRADSARSGGRRHRRLEPPRRHADGRVTAPRPPPPTPQRVVELEKVNAQLALGSPSWRRRRATWRSAPPRSQRRRPADGEADALRMKVSDQTALKAKGRRPSPRRRGPPAGKAEEKAKMRVVSLALRQPRHPRCCPRCCDGARWRPAE